jgi:amino acid transporter
MSFEEKSTWVQGALAVVTYGIYLGVVLGQARVTELTDVDYVPPLLWTIGASIVASIIVHIVVAMFSPRDADKKDTRDRQIYRRGEYVGHTFVIAGALGALILAMLQVDQFWIANVIYLCFVLSTILATIAKVYFYRRGLPAW